MLSVDELDRLRDHATANPSHAGDVVLRLVAEVGRLRRATGRGGEHATNGEDLGNLVRRLRRFAERWPYEESIAEMAREAADEIARLVAEVERLRAGEQGLARRLEGLMDSWYSRRHEHLQAPDSPCPGSVPPPWTIAVALTGCAEELEAAIVNRLTADEEAEAQRLDEELQRDIAAGDPWGCGPGA